MSNNIIFHENSLKKFKEPKKKKENWLEKETSSFKYIHFSLTPKPKKIAQEKLAELDLNFSILEEKYQTAIDSIVCICDDQGKTLWMNSFLKNLVFQGKTDIYMKPLFHPNNCIFEIHQDSNTFEFSKVFEKKEIIETETCEYIMNILYVRKLKSYDRKGLIIRKGVYLDF